MQSRHTDLDLPFQSYDYIVVGAGTCGCIVANRLTEDPNISVLLVEAGGMMMIQNFPKRVYQLFLASGSQI